MPNRQKVELRTKTIYGLQTRTKNVDEMNPDTGKIAPLWGRYYNEVLPNLGEGTTVYGVYYNYESDATGMFDVLAGSEQ